MPELQLRGVPACCSSVTADCSTTARGCSRNPVIVADVTTTEATTVKMINQLNLEATLLVTLAASPSCEVWQASAERVSGH